MIVHIVPTVPPELNGLADYSFKLSQHWPDAGASWSCLALRLPEEAQKNWPGANFSLFEPSQQGLSAALQKLDESAEIEVLVLHYVGYAYQPKGVPTWLPAVLAGWKKAHPQQSLVVMFHELWATGAPWRSCFWVLPTAKSIVSQLAAASDFWITSCQNYFDKVVSVGGKAGQGAVIPIATNIEPSAPIDFGRPWPLFQGKPLKIAVFGLATTRNTALSVHAGLLKELCEQNLIERISLLGQSPQNEKVSAKLASIRAEIGGESLWQTAYDLSPAEASKLLREQDLGVVKETAPFLAKSTVFAAFCSHGVLPVCAGKNALDEKLESPFLTAFDAKECVMSLRDPGIIAAKKRNMESVATTSLLWSSVARSWVQHIEPAS